MKLPFASCIGSNLKRYRRFYCRFCSACGLGQWWFVICLGFLGAVVAVLDILDLISATSRPLMPESMWRHRLHRGSQRLVSPEAERDLKLMVTILSVEHYLLMIFGVLQMNPALLMPWLMMEAVVIALEAVFFGMRLFVEGLSISGSDNGKPSLWPMADLNKFPGKKEPALSSDEKVKTNVSPSLFIEK